MDAVSEIKLNFLFDESLQNTSPSLSNTKATANTSMAEQMKLYQLHRFNGENFHLWCRQMEIFMTENKLKPYIVGAIQQPQENTESWDAKDAEAQAFLMRGLELEQLKYLTDCKTAAAMWSRLKTVHSERSDQSVQVLLDKFINCKMDREEKVSDYIAKIISYAQRVKDMDMEQKTPMVIAKILGSLPERFDNVRTAWYAVPKPSQTIEKLTDHLVNEEILMNSRMSTNNVKVTEEVFTVRTKQRITGNRYTNTFNAGNGSYSKSDNFKSNVKCNYCNNFGHYARECRKKKFDRHDSVKNYSYVAQSSSNNLDYANDDCLNESQLFTVESCVDSKDCVYNYWYLDSGATDNMTFRKDWLVNFVRFTEKYPVRLGDNYIIDAEGKGDVHVQVKTQSNRIITHIMTEVLYVPNLKRNLISVARTTKKGIRIIFEETGKHVFLLKQSKLLVSGTVEKNMYRLKFQTVSCSEREANANVAVGSTLMNWHERLGHPNFRVLRTMQKLSAVNDLEITDLFEENPFCEPCVKAKQHRESFPKNNAIRSKLPGEIIHVDLCGKMPNVSIGGAYYFMLLKDDFSRYCFVYLLKDKTEILLNLKRFYAEVQAQGHQIKRLRSDRGLEFCNEEVRDFLLSKGIKHETTTPRAPEQNGLIERSNRTIVESAKAMLAAKGLPVYLWGEAVNTAVYLKNRTISETINNTTPFEKWFGFKPSVKHIKIFGSDCYVHIPKDQRLKWDSNTLKCVLVGYNDDSKAYRVYDPLKRKVFVRRDVILNEKGNENKVNTVLEISSSDAKTDVKDGSLLHERVEIFPSSKTEEGEVSDRRTPFKNPRFPIARDPYALRKNLRSKGQEQIETNFAEVFLATVEPLTLEDAMDSTDANQWLDAIHEELDSLNRNHTWILVPRPKNKNIIKNRWVFKRKYKTNGEVDKFKARLVVKGCSQRQGIDYEETFAPVVRYESVRLILSIAASLNLRMIQFDVKTAFLHGDLDDPIYMEQPYGFEYNDDLVCLLKRSLYGLKQAPRQWNLKIVTFLTDRHFIQSHADPCIFIYKSSEIDIKIFIALYVDDGLICGNNANFIANLLRDLQNEFQIVYDEAQCFVGLQIERSEDHGEIKIHQKAYAERILQKFNHLECSLVSTPIDNVNTTLACINNEENNNEKFPYREAVGSLMFLMIMSRPDLAFAVGILSRFMHNPNYVHWVAVKRVLKYIKGTLSYGITYRLNTNDIELTAYCDADWANDPNTRRSVTGWILFCNNGPVAWSSRKQSVTATSTTEAEFIALCTVTKEVIWFRNLLRELSLLRNNATRIYCDNQRAISIVVNPYCVKRTKHIDVQFFYTCEKQKEREIDVNYVPSENQLADMLTKPVTREKLQSFVRKCGMCYLSQIRMREEVLRYYAF